MSESGFDPNQLLSEVDQIKERNQREKQEMLDANQRELDASKRARNEELDAIHKSHYEDKKSRQEKINQELNSITGVSKRQEPFSELKINVEKPEAKFERVRDAVPAAPTIKHPVK